MKFSLFRNIPFLSQLILLTLLLCSDLQIQAQKHEADSLQRLLNTRLHDTMRVKNMRYLSFAMYKYNPDSALIVAYEGLKFAKKIAYKAGISNSYEVIGSILSRTGNYNKALGYFIENLKIEESLKSIDGIITAKNNIGIVYTNLEDYDNALKSYLISDSLVKIFNDSDTDYMYTLKYITALNIGDVYEKMHKREEAFLYYNKSLDLAVAKKENYRIGKSMLGLGNIYAANNTHEMALANYKLSLQYLMEANDEDLVCEVTLGMAKVYKRMQLPDTARHYAGIGLYFAKKNNFSAREHDISIFLSDYFAGNKQPDSAYYYLRNSQALKDSLLGIEKLRVSQQIIFNENLRQLELLEKAQQEKEERRQQLQHVFIGLLIPTLFLITILLARVRIRIRFLKFLGVISLLFLFEYLTLLLHPLVQKITHHTPLLEILIFVAIAALLIPTHHKIEHWLIEMLAKRVQNRAKQNTGEGDHPSDRHNETEVKIVAVPQSKPLK